MQSFLKIFILLAFSFLNSVATQSVPRLSSQDEWRALLDLRSSLGISTKDWHRKVNPCLNWTGIECNENGRVTSIKLLGLRRTVRGKLNPGFDVDSLPTFTLLSSFNSSGFMLRGSIPEWLGDKLSNLESLDLSSSSIRGSIPSSLGSLSKLSFLSLSNNSITGNLPTTLEKLVSLSELNLSQNSLTGQIPSEISALRNLTKLDFSLNYFAGGIPPDFGTLSSLKLLNLSHNSLSSTVPPQLGNLSELEQLDLGSNALVDSLPQELGRLRKLRKILVGKNELSGSLPLSLFENLTQLEYLVLSRNNFGYKLPNALWSMSNLKYLDVSWNNLTGEFPSSTAHFNVSGVVFNFSHNKFSGNLSYGFGKIGFIDISNNYFNGSAPNDNQTNISYSNNCFVNVPNQRNYDDCGRFYYGVEGNSSKPQHMKSQKRLTYVVVGVFGGLGFIIALTGVMFLLVRACKIGNTNHQKEVPNVRALEGGIEWPSKAFIDLSGLGEPFTYEKMVLATCNFSTENLLKSGHSGDLFHGTLEGGISVVIKRVDLRTIKKDSYMSELDLFSKAKHRRLVPLVGHCLEDESEKFLVYKYMPNGDLSNALYRKTNADVGLLSLDWITRLKIAIGAAEALSYLHHECTPPFVHRDIQASSILLDDKYEVRLGSLSEVYGAGCGNSQNMVARLLRSPQASGKRPSGSTSTTCKYDVYCFGKVLLELVTGKLGISTLNEADAKQWIDKSLQSISVYEKDMVTKIVDESLVIDEDLLEEVWAVAVVAKSCLNPKASRRPSMRNVLRALENPFKVVREEKFSSGSSRRSWTAALFGSWNNHSSSDISNVSTQTSREIVSGLRQQAERAGSRSSGANDRSSSHKRSSSDVFPEPVEMQDVETQNSNSYKSEYNLKFSGI